MQQNPRTALIREVRMALCRHMIDISRLNMRVTTNQRLMVTGWLKRLPGCSMKLSPDIVSAIFSELRHIGGLKGVNVDLQNWQQGEGGGGWMMLDVPEEAMGGTKIHGPAKVVLIRQSEKPAAKTPPKPESE